MGNILSSMLDFPHHLNTMVLPETMYRQLRHQGTSAHPIPTLASCKGMILKGKVPGISWQLPNNPFFLAKKESCLYDIHLFMYFLRE